MTGADCSVPPQEGVWYQTLVAASPQQRASHAAVLEAETMWVVAGHHFATDGFENIARLDLSFLFEICKCFTQCQHNLL